MAEFLIYTGAGIIIGALIMFTVCYYLYVKDDESNE